MYSSSLILLPPPLYSMVEQTLITDTAATSPSSPDHSSTSPSSSKIYFRSRKIRKISNHSKQIIETTTTTNRNPPPSPPVSILPRPLTAAGELSSAISHLRSAVPILSSVIDSHSLPSFFCESKPSSFHSLARSILYQQLAFKSASSIYSRFLSLSGASDGCGDPLPSSVLNLSPLQLRQIGVSARKASYLHDLASKFHSGVLSDSSLVAMDDSSLLSTLTMVKGIGPWSVHMFMIFSLHRPDVLPVGDLGVRKGVQILHGLKEVPKPSEMEMICDKWRPYRSVGAWYMWRLVESKGSATMASLGCSDSPDVA